MPSNTHFAKPRYSKLLLASSLAINTLALVLPLVTMQIYDRVLPNRVEDMLLVLASGVILAAVAELTLRMCRSMVLGLNSANFEHEAAIHALAHVLDAEPRTHANVTAPLLTQDIGSAARLKDYYGGQMMVALLVDTPFTLVFLGLEAYLAGWLALVPAAVLGLFLAISWKQGTRLRTLMHVREQQDDARYAFIAQALQVAHSVKALCLEALMARRFEEVQRESGQLNYRIACLHGQSGSLSYGFAQLMAVAVVCFGAPMAASAHISVGTLIACVLLSGQAMQPLQRGLGMWIGFQDIALAKERLGNLLALPRREFIALEALEAGHGAMRLERVRFGYGDGSPILDGADLDIAPGDTVAITGGSGVGKTTLLQLMAGIYAPDKGRVLLSGMDVSRLPVSERSRYLAYLPMNGMILRGSIMDNLTGFNPQLRQEARKVADQLGIEEAVSLLPSGYDTPLEGRTTDIVPPGLKQRISIARALLHKPRLVLFDNADRGMDHESCARILSLMARLKGRATLVLVSEDRSILSLADHVFDLRGGQLTAVMSPAPLAGRRLAKGA